ncbi:MAG: methyltransferase domain-containing protein [Actinomycetota bacterium]|nr:methyltransferase domain-containing protein [Actinomycetota bacterium]
MFEKSAEYYDALYSWKDYEAEVAKLHDLIQEHRPGARTLLDVACGTGKHLELLREHYEVEGLDLDANLLEIAQERNPGVTFHAGDMTSFDLGRTFDVVICLFSSIGYVQTQENLERATQTLARHVSAGGLLLIEPWLRPDTYEVGHIGLLVVDEAELKIVRMNESRRDGDLSVLDFHYLIAEHGSIEHLRETHRLGLFTDEQHVQALRNAGLEVRPSEDLRMGRGLYVALNPL